MIYTDRKTEFFLIFKRSRSEDLKIINFTKKKDFINKGTAGII